MRSWFEYGYQGFPSGEQRRRFYRQRDDPCDSEDECDFDYTNDRPIYYYPLRESEGRCSSSCHSAVSLSRVSEADGEVEHGHGGHSLPFFLQTTAYVTVPAWYGSSFITFTSHAPNSSHTRYGLWHGGAAVVNCSVGSQFHLAELRSVSQTSGLRGGQSQTVDYVPFPEDESLAELINWPLSHPAFQAVTDDVELLREAHVPRFGHCAVYVDLPPEMVTSHLTSGWAPTTTAQGDCRPATSRGYLHERVAHPEDFELHLSFVIGGASSVPAGAGPHTALRHARYAAVSRPAECLTLIRRPRGGAPGAHFTTTRLLRGPFDLPVAPRLFATLTALPGAAPGRAFAYLGGTPDGRAPLPRFDLLVVRVGGGGWSAGPAPTLGVPPAPRFGHSATAHGDRLWVCGGLARAGAPLRDLHVLDPSTRVWREVFVPLRRGVPARAFHGAAITALPRGGEALLLVGGQGAEGAPEPSVWAMLLHDCTWQRVTFPLQREVVSFGVADPLRPASPGADSAPQAAVAVAQTTPGTFLSPRRLHQTVLALHERGLRHDAYDSFRKDAPASRGPWAEDAEPLVFATCHGSLFQLLSLPSENPGLVIFGGTQSPPILLATNIIVPTGSLKERTAFWLFCDNPDSLRIKSILNRTPHLVRNMFAGTQFLNFFTSPENDSNRDQFRCHSSLEATPSPDFVEEANRLANESVLADTLAMWVRAARKRLMEK